MKNIKIFIVASLAWCMLSCGEDTVVDIPTHDESGKIVIEGNATDDGNPCNVRITKSIKISDTKSKYISIANAVVVIRDNKGNSETLRYIDGLYKTVNFQTLNGNIYTLTVNVDGQTYNATSRMPEYVELDDVIQTTYFNGLGNVIGVVPIFTDPETSGNRYLFKTYVNNHKAEITVLDDNGENGSVNTIPVSTKPDPVKNDKVVIEMQSIDSPVYDYFKALSNVSVQSGGGIVTPSNPPSNFDNGALGYFSAHTTVTETIIIK
ncbi:protein of unknown function [Chryseobacterium oleae]|uniref:DUF4249 domain-containing protein n=1 Tax=Chryseobacterium oleae TaxID=491207 RepID=A0A1I5AQW9_CHROL|nr:DUF4249 family protein [Chryseobacterium oleae]SFN64841.1 protein of unknown function [Chryseobacterium oleae]